MTNVHSVQRQKSLDIKKEILNIFYNDPCRYTDYCNKFKKFYFKHNVAETERIFFDEFLEQIDVTRAPIIFMGVEIKYSSVLHRCHTDECHRLFKQYCHSLEMLGFVVKVEDNIYCTSALNNIINRHKEGLNNE